MPPCVIMLPIKKLAAMYYINTLTCSILHVMVLQISERVCQKNCCSCHAMIKQFW